MKAKTHTYDDKDGTGWQHQRVKGNEFTTVVVKRNPAHGVETKRQLITQDPHSSLASKSLSEPARALRAARNDDIEAYEWLLNRMATMIELKAKTENWRMKYDALVIAEIVVKPYIGHAISKRTAAEMCGVHVESFRTAWEPKLIAIESWVKGWNAELNR